MDIGSGTGGVDVVLVREHHAATVVGIDVQAEQVDIATRRADDLGLSERITYRVVEPESHLPFPGDSFDVVFSKDSIVHVRAKAALYSEALRVLRPGGRLLASDWLRGDGELLDAAVERFVEAAGHDFAMVTLSELGAIVANAGFVEVDLEDRGAWYREEAAAELARIRGPLHAQFVDRWGEDAAAAEIEFWEVLVEALGSGAMRPGHVRAVKPTAPF